MTTRYNNLSISIYERNSTAPLTVRDYRPDYVSDIELEKFWPGGLYGTLTYRINQKLVNTLYTMGAYRVVVSNNGATVYEGYITNKSKSASQTEQAQLITCAGAWGDVIARNSTSRLWATQNLGLWHVSGYTQVDQFATGQSYNSLFFTPNFGKGFVSGDFVTLRFDARAGQTIARVTYDYVVSFAHANDWLIYMRRSNDGSTWTPMTAVSGETYNTGTTTAFSASASGSIDVELGTPSRYIEFRFSATDTNTIANGDIITAVLSNVTIYNTTAAVTAHRVLTDAISDLSSAGLVNSDATWITDAPTVDLTEMMALPHRETWDTVLTRCVSGGDASAQSYAVYTVESDAAKSPDGRPIIACDQYKDTSGYEYVVSGQHTNIGPMNIYEDYSTARSTIYVVYTDPRTGQPAEVSATLANDYGSKAEVVNVGYMSEANAQDYADRILAAYNSPRWRVDEPIQVLGYIYQQSRCKLPASQIVPGNRIMFQDYPPAPGQTSASSLVLTITRVLYNDNAETATLYMGDMANDIAAPMSFIQSGIGILPTPRYNPPDAGIW